MRWLVAAAALGMAGDAMAETYVPLGFVEISCTQPGVEVQLDGTVWFSCPGLNSKQVSAGPHSVVADLLGHLPVRENVLVPENGVRRIDLSLLRLDRPIVVEHRFPRWLPWTVGLSGLAIVGLGGLVSYAGSEKMDEYDQALGSMCAVSGCDLEDPQFAYLTDIRDRAETLNTTGSLMILGGIAVVGTGIVLYVINKPVRQVPDVAVVPTGNGVAAQAGWRF